MSLKTLENRGLSPILADFADFGGLSPILILVVCPRFCADFARRFCYDLTTAMVSTICNSSGELLRGFPVCPVNPKIFGPILDISHRGNISIDSISIEQVVAKATHGGGYRDPCANHDLVQRKRGQPNLIFDFKFTLKISQPASCARGHVSRV